MYKRPYRIFSYNGLDWSGSGEGQVEGCCEHGNEQLDVSIYSMYEFREKRKAIVYLRA